jgi:flagellar hook-length control protein FliK
MAGNGVQTAQIRVTPDELGPITVQVHLQGSTANVLLSSAHEQTRLVLESSLGGLRDALAAGGLSLGQASVGSEQQQRNMFAGTESGDRRQSDTDPAFSFVEGTVPAPALATSQHTSGVTRQGTGLVNLYA